MYRLTEITLIVSNLELCTGRKLHIERAQRVLYTIYNHRLIFDQLIILFPSLIPRVKLLLSFFPFSFSPPSLFVIDN